MRNPSTLYAIDGLFRILSNFIQPLPPTPPTPATFYKVSVSPGDGGTVSQSALYVKEGGSVTLSARPDYGYKFLKWDDDETDNPRTITNIQDNITLAAVFKEKVPPTPPADPDYLCFTAEKAGSTLSMFGFTEEGVEVEPVALEYSTDNGVTWQKWHYTNGEYEEMDDVFYDKITFSQKGDKVLFRGNNEYGTCIVLPGNDEPSGSFVFIGGNGTSEDNVFSVSGDLQTIVDKTGQNKQDGQFTYLFSKLLVEEELGLPGITITSAPDLTKTTLIKFDYTLLFSGQNLLTAEATMPDFSLSDLPEFGLCFGQMYDGTGVTEPHVFTGIRLPEIFDEESFESKFNNFYSMFAHTPANMTTDNGETLTMFPNVEFPLILDEESFSTFDFARNLLNNTNGFSTINIHGYCNEENAWGNINTRCGSSYEQCDESNRIVSWWVPTNETIQVELIANSHGLFVFQKWQTSADEGTTWVDAGTDNPMTVQFSQAGDYYIKMFVFSEYNTAHLDVGYNSTECEIDCFYDPQPVGIRTLNPGDSGYNYPFVNETVCIAYCPIVNDSANCGIRCIPKAGYEFVEWQIYYGIWEGYGEDNPTFVSLGGEGSETYVRAICQPKSDSSISSSDISANSNTPEIIGG